MGVCASAQHVKAKEDALLGGDLHQAHNPSVVTGVKEAYLHVIGDAERIALATSTDAEGNLVYLEPLALDGAAHDAALKCWAALDAGTKKELLSRGFDVLNEVETQEFGSALWSRLTLNERCEAFREAMCIDIELERKEKLVTNGGAEGEEVNRGGSEPRGAAVQTARTSATVATADGDDAGTTDTERRDQGAGAATAAGGSKDHHDAVNDGDAGSTHLHLKEMRELHSKMVSMRRESLRFAETFSAASTPWIRYIDAETGHYYYTHDETGESVWLLPLGVTARDGEAALQGGQADDTQTVTHPSSGSSSSSSSAAVRRNSMAMFTAALGEVELYHDDAHADGIHDDESRGEKKSAAAVPATPFSTPLPVSGHSTRYGAASKRWQKAAIEVKSVQKTLKALSPKLAAKQQKLKKKQMKKRRLKKSGPPDEGTNEGLLKSLKIRLRKSGVQNVFDTLKSYDDGDGELSYEEFEEGIFSVAGWNGGEDGEPASDPIIDASRRRLAHSLFATFDADGGGSVNMKELAGGLTPLCSDPDDIEATCRCIFDLYDDDGSGELSSDELEQYVISMLAGVAAIKSQQEDDDDEDDDDGHDAEEEAARACAKRTELAKMMTQKVFLEVDTDGSGLIDYNEFSTWFIKAKNGRGGHAEAAAKRKALAAEGEEGKIRRAAEESVRLNAQLALYCGDDERVEEILEKCRSDRKEDGEEMALRVRTGLDPNLCNEDEATKLRAELPSIAARLERLSRESTAESSVEMGTAHVAMNALSSDGGNLLTALIRRSPAALSGDLLARICVEAPLTTLAALLSVRGGDNAMVALFESAYLTHVLLKPVINLLHKHAQDESVYKAVRAAKISIAHVTTSTTSNGSYEGGNVMHALCANVCARVVPADSFEITLLDPSTKPTREESMLGSLVGCCSPAVIEETLAAPQALIAALLGSVSTNGCTPLHAFVAEHVASAESRVKAARAWYTSETSVEEETEEIVNGITGSFDWLVMSAEHKELTSSGALVTKDNNGRTVLHLLCELLSGNDAQLSGAFGVTLLESILAHVDGASLCSEVKGRVKRQNAMHVLGANRLLRGESKSLMMDAYAFACPEAGRVRDGGGMTPYERAAEAER